MLCYVYYIIKKCNVFGVCWRRVLALICEASGNFFLCNVVGRMCGTLCKLQSEGRLPFTVTL